MVVEKSKKRDNHHLMRITEQHISAENGKIVTKVVIHTKLYQKIIKADIGSQKLVHKTVLNGLTNENFNRA